MSADSSQWDVGRFLIGFVNEGEALQAMANGEFPQPDIQHLRNVWKGSVETVRGRAPLQIAEPDVESIPARECSEEMARGLDRVRKRLSSDPNLSSLQWDLKLVGIDGLVTIQKQVNVTAANTVGSAVRDCNDLEGAVKLALLTELPRSPISVVQDGQGVLVSSRNLNLSLTGTGMIEAENELGDKMTNATVSFGCLHSYVRIMHFNGRYYVRDGYHRVYALKQKGFTQVPAIVAETNNPADIAPPGNLFTLPLLLSDNPPLVDDFDRNAVDVKVPRLTKVIRIKLEQFVVPS